MPDSTPKATPGHHGAWPNDQGVWLMCFTAAIHGHLAGLEKTTTEVPPESIADRCAKIADAALAEERKRRPTSE